MNTSLKSVVPSCFCSVSVLCVKCLGYLLYTTVNLHCCQHAAEHVMYFLTFVKRVGLCNDECLFSDVSASELNYLENLRLALALYVLYILC